MNHSVTTNPVSAATRRISRSAAQLASITALGILLGSACISEDMGLDPMDDGDTGYLFGLTEHEIADTAQFYGADPQTALDAMRAPFACERFGALCEGGEATARELLAQSFELALERVPMETLGEMQVEARQALVTDNAKDGYDHGIDRSKASGYVEYTNQDGNLRRVTVTATIDNMVLYHLHSALVRHLRPSNDPNQEWETTPGHLKAEMDSERCNDGQLVATKSWDDAGYTSEFSHSYTMSNPGVHKLEVCGTVNAGTADEHGLCRYVTQ